MHYTIVISREILLQCHRQLSMSPIDTDRQRPIAIPAIPRLLNAKSS